MVELGKRIREQRNKCGLTLDEVAAKTNIQKSTLSKLENGKMQRIDRGYIDRLARLYRCDPAYLMGYEDTPHVDLTYSAPGRENVNTFIVDHNQSRPIMGESAKRTMLYAAALAVPPHSLDIAIQLLQSLSDKGGEE